MLQLQSFRKLTVFPSPVPEGATYSFHGCLYQWARPDQLDPGVNMSNFTANSFASYAKETS